MFDRFTFNGKTHEIWCNSNIGLFYGDAPQNKVPIMFLALVLLKPTICDQLQIESDLWKTAVLQHANEIMVYSARLLRSKNTLEWENVKYKAALYLHCHELIELMKPY